MSEALVQIKEKAGFDPIANALADRPGDVIVVCPDGWPWTKEELTNPEWCVLKMPGQPVGALNSMCPPVFDAAGRMVSKHAQNFDMTNITVSGLLKTGEVIADASQKTTLLASVVTKNVAAVTIG